MRYIESPSTDPALNLALEQYVFDTLSCSDEFFMLWQNRDSVIVGLHQNTAQEINRPYVDQNGIAVVRRLSGGGAVFHDLGNINFSFITSVPDSGRLDCRSSCKPVMEALNELGVRPEASGRNDLVINGRKFSGNARYFRNGRLMHHGTVLFDTDLKKMAEALRAPEDEFASKAVQSVRARVTNLRAYLPRDMKAMEFREFLRKSIAGKRDMPAYTMTGRDWNAVETIRRQRYAAWEWNYGQSPDYSIRKRRHLPGFGDVWISMQVEKGRVAAFAADGGGFGRRPCAQIAAALLHTKMEAHALREALSGIRPEEFCGNLSRDEFIRLILD